MKTRNHDLLFSVLLGIAGVSTCLAAPPKGGNVSIERVEPAQLARGAVTAVVVQGIGLEKIDAVEVTPADGITVAEITAAPSTKKKQQRWVIRLQATSEAALGDRSLVVVTPKGRSPAVRLFIPSHVPKVSEAKLELLEGIRLMVAFTVEVFDDAADLSESPSVSMKLLGAHGGYAFDCGGVITHRSGNRNYVVAAALIDSSLKATGTCELQISVKDRNGFASDWLSVPVTFK